MTRRIAVVGAGLSGVAAFTSLVRQAVDQHKADLSVTLFDPAPIGPGMAYDIDGPDDFLLNHELNFMGSANVKLNQVDVQDFFCWVQDNYGYLAKLYPTCDLKNPQECVPRSLFGRYVVSRYSDTKAYAVSHGIDVKEVLGAASAVKRRGGKFLVICEQKEQVFDVVILTTGTFFVPNKQLERSGKYFLPYDYKRYVSPNIPKGSVLLVLGTALTAYDVALYGLRSGTFSKVAMVSRRGMLRRVRGKVVPYERKYLTVKKLRELALPNGGKLQLQQLLDVVRQELQSAYGRQIQWRAEYSPQEIVGMLKADLEHVSQDKVLWWRSVHNSLSDDERHAIYAMLAPEAKHEFVRTYSSLYQLFSAPMPAVNAQKLLQHFSDDTLQLFNQVQRVIYNADSAKFEAECGDGATVRADVCVDASGLGRDVSRLPLYKQLLADGLAVKDPLGGIQVDSNRRVLDGKGGLVRGLYAIGHMTCGTTVLPHNSIQVARLAESVGAEVIGSL